MLKCLGIFYYSRKLISKIEINTKQYFFKNYRWAELTRKLEFHVEVQELNESGEYAPVEVQPRNAVGTGGIFQLRQGKLFYLFKK